MTPSGLRYRIFSLPFSRCSVSSLPTSVEHKRVVATTYFNDIGNNLFHRCFAEIRREIGKYAPILPIPEGLLGMELLYSGLSRRSYAETSASIMIKQSVFNTMADKCL